MNRAQRKTIAHETLDIIKDGYYINQNNNRISIKSDLKKTIENTTYYTSETLDELKDNLYLEKKHNTKYIVTNEDSVSCIIRLSKEGKKGIMCLNFASAKNPGGGFLNGALAQEESLSTSSGLYASQMSAFEYYTNHRRIKTGVYSDAMILSPNTPVFRNKDGELLDQHVLCNFITSAAVNRSAIPSKETLLLDAIPKIMTNRIDKLLSICVAKNYETLILGAWGCGVFQNNPEVIAKLFHKQLNSKFKHQFKHVVFAIYSKNKTFINAFKTEFNSNLLNN